MQQAARQRRPTGLAAVRAASSRGAHIACMRTACALYLPGRRLAGRLRGLFNRQSPRFDPSTRVERSALLGPGHGAQTRPRSPQSGQARKSITACRALFENPSGAGTLVERAADFQQGSTASTLLLLVRDMPRGRQGGGCKGSATVLWWVFSLQRKSSKQNVTCMKDVLSGNRATNSAASGVMCVWRGASTQGAPS